MMNECVECSGPTERTGDDNEHTGEVVCEECFPALEWLHTHTPDECDDGPGTYCHRDHGQEILEGAQEFGAQLAREMSW